MNILDEILEYKKDIVVEQKRALQMSEASMIDACSESPSRSFIEKIQYTKENNEIALIAEVKKASPSKGIIKEKFNPVEIAKQYEQNGAGAISVLTDEKYFKGSIEYLKSIRNTVALPVLRKDFIVDSFQIYHSKMIQADMILLIASALSEAQLKEYYEMAKSVGLEVLIEAHNEQELDIALNTNAKLIGINNRNLKNFEVSLSNTIELIKNKQIDDKFIISESGIHSNKDVTLLKENGVSGILVGESLVRQENIGGAVKALLI